MSSFQQLCLLAVVVVIVNAVFNSLVVVASKLIERRSPRFRVSVTCPRCCGTGKYQRFPNDLIRDCAVCGGKGEIFSENRP